MTTADSPVFYNNCLEVISEEVLESPSDTITLTLYNYETWIFIPARVFSELRALGVSFSKEENSTMKIVYKASQVKTENLNLYAILSACRNSATVDIHGFSPPFIMFSPIGALVSLVQSDIDRDVQKFSTSGRTLCLDIFNDGFVVMVKERFGGELKMHCFIRENAKINRSLFTTTHGVISLTSPLAHALYLISSGYIEPNTERDWIKIVQLQEPVIKHASTMIAMSIISGIDMRPLLSNKILVSATNF